MTSCLREPIHARTLLQRHRRLVASAEAVPVSLSVSKVGRSPCRKRSATASFPSSLPLTPSEALTSLNLTLPVCQCATFTNATRTIETTTSRIDPRPCTSRLSRLSASSKPLIREHLGHAREERHGPELDLVARPRRVAVPHLADPPDQVEVVDVVQRRAVVAPLGRLDRDEPVIGACSRMSDQISSSPPLKRQSRRRERSETHLRARARCPRECGKHCSTTA